MSWILDEPEPQQPTATILNFPPCCLGIGYVPERVSWREWARIEIASWRARRARGAENGSNQGSEASDAPNAAQINAQSTENRFQDRDLCWSEPRTPVSTVISDVSGNPREIRCAKSQLENILSARDELEARKARGTVRRR